MSDAPLLSAHTHARNGHEQYSKTARKASSEQYQLAADDFSRAARTTSDAEAFRVLKLLEAQHARLARIVQREDTVATEQATHEGSPSNEPTPAVSQKTALPAPKSTEPTVHTKAKRPSANIGSRIGSQVRESSPSLARDIASRRGIPPGGKGSSLAASRAQRNQVSPEVKRERCQDLAASHARIPPSIMDSQGNLQDARKAKKTEDDEGFSRFYNSLATGTMSKLSSALAYAGLPLTVDDTKPEQPPQKRTVSANTEPDVKKYISKAALDAMEYQHRQSESFYVVQTGGGTYSYADITKHRQAPLSAMDEDDEDSFVDAREIPGPSSPKVSRLVSQRRGPFSSAQSDEELALENATLKDTINLLSSRLSRFEAHAQDAAMASMTQSMMYLQRPAGDSDLGTQQRLKELEQQLERQAEERQQLQDQAAKQAKTIRKYESKWTTIRNSALEKDRAKRERAEKDSGGDGGSGTVALKDV